MAIVFRVDSPSYLVLKRGYWNSNIFAALLTGVPLFKTARNASFIAFSSYFFVLFVHFSGVGLKNMEKIV